MKPRMRMVAWLSVPAALGALDCAALDSTPTLKLSKSLKEADKPAEFIYTQASGKDASEVWNVAGTLDYALPLPANSPTTSVSATASIAKDTITAKPADTRAFTAGLRSLLLLAEHETLPVGVYASAEDDQVKKAHGQLYRGQVEWISSNYLQWKPALGSQYLLMDLFPRIGYFSRTVRGAQNGINGRFGGPYAYAYFIARFGQVTAKDNWFTSLQLELTAQVAKDSVATDGFVKATRRFYEGTISYKFYDASSGSGWKPSIGLTRTVGEDPILNQPYKVQTAASFRVSYGF